jgi:hypothetical protein
MAPKSTAKRSAASRAEPKPQLTESAAKPISVADNVKAYADVSASNRWATILKVEDPKDPREEVINISLMEGNVPPAANDLAEEGNEHAAQYAYQRVAGGVVIGMRRGGEFESVDGFGWKDAADKAARGNPNGGGATRVLAEARSE